MSVSAIVSAATTIGTNISTGGTLTVTGASSLTGALTMAGNASTTGSAVIKSATINSDTGAISFGNENLTTTGTLTVTGTTTFTNASSTGILYIADIRSETGTTTFTNSDIYLNNGANTSLYLANNSDIFGMEVAGPGWRINDSSGNFTMGGGLLSGVATALFLQVPVAEAASIAGIII